MRSSFLSSKLPQDIGEATTPRDALLDRLAISLGGSNDHSPIYMRLAMALADAIDGGHLGRGRSLPSERLLAERLNISRVSVRRAIAELEGEGRVNRRHGARTVVQTRVRKDLPNLTGFSDEIRARGMEPSFSWISRGTVIGTLHETMALGLPVQTEVIRLIRVRHADGIPIALERAVVPKSILPDAMLVTDSLYATLASLNARPHHGFQRIRADVMSVAEAELLQAAPQTPMLVAERRCFLEDGRAIEFTETRYNGKVYDFISDLHL
ncbi:GntR family transcriptional regulator [Aliirhizobium smilacinae]|uniref:GntR family transcriptional regulator n=1 Tax=Aliirhizobium smilacinae TaxID=1395944 RepID=A0A5C4X9K4_9HYPH|nr:GntR family transcriptional regulator [Rhizobium smilacinae]